MNFSNWPWRPSPCGCRCAVLAPMLVAFSLLVSACAPKQDGANDRFLYVVDCVARVDKLDTQEGKWISSFFLSERSPLVPPPPPPG